MKNLNNGNASSINPNDDNYNSSNKNTDFGGNDSNINVLLNSVRIVMVNTTLPANIGSAARAMFTMGLTDLVVVDPKLPIDEDSIAHAAGAKDVLENCKIVENIEQATSDCQIVFASSSRQRYIPRPVVTPLQAAQLITQYVESLDNIGSQDTDTSLNSNNRVSRDNSSNSDISSLKNLSNEQLIDSTLTIDSKTAARTNLKNYRPKIAILFGREDRGLTNEELSLADYHIQIDANPNYPVLNVASAVQVISSFLYSHFLSHTQSLSNSQQQQIASHGNSDSDSNQSEVDIFIRHVWDAPAINQQQKLSLQTRVIELMSQLELIESTETEKLRSLPNRLSRLLSRLQLDKKEYEIVSAIIAKVKNKI